MEPPASFAPKLQKIPLNLLFPLISHSILYLKSLSLLLSSLIFLNNLNALIYLIYLISLIYLIYLCSLFFLLLNSLTSLSLFHPKQTQNDYQYKRRQGHKTGVAHLVVILGETA